MTDNYRVRSIIVFILILGCFGFLGYRFYSIQINQHAEYLARQEEQFYSRQEIPPKAGMILDRSGKIMALSKAVNSVAVIPKTFSENPANFSTVSKILKIPEGELRNKVKNAQDNRKSFIWIKRRITAEESQSLRSKKIKGIEFREEYQRFYPNNNLACHILGFRGLDEKPLGGVELSYHRQLIGETGYRLVPRDARHQKVLSLDNIEKPPVPGKNIYLTIDTVIQYIAEDELDKACQKYRPLSAEVIILKTTTGEILAWANRPFFDPNNPSKVVPESQRNRSVSDIYEPGSVFKPFIASTLLTKKMVDPDEVIFCENGKFKIGGRIIHDHKPNAGLTFTEIIAKSSNIGMAKLGMRLGKDYMYETLGSFDFGRTTGIELPGEVDGMITPQDRWNDYTVTSVPMGHEIGVTSIQLLKAFNVFANNGLMMKPYLVQRVADATGKITQETKPTTIRQVLTPPAANQVKMMLRAVVEKGTATMANLKDYTLAGKTGTAQKINPDGTYSHNKFRSIFVGFAPVENPEILVLVQLDEPKGNYYGGVVAAPVVANIVRKTLKYLAVPARVGIASTDE